MVTGLAVGCRVEPGHEFAVGGAGGSEFAVAFVQLELQVGDVLVQIGDLVVERVDVGGGAEPGFAPCLVAERLGQAGFELLDAGGEPESALVGGEQVSLQGGRGDGRAGAGAGGQADLGGVDLAEQVAVPVEERPVDALLTELCLEFQQFSG
jgi:hypothetical protein